MSTPFLSPVICGSITFDPQTQKNFGHFGSACLDWISSTEGAADFFYLIRKTTNLTAELFCCMPVGLVNLGQKAAGFLGAVAILRLPRTVADFGATCLHANEMVHGRKHVSAYFVNDLFHRVLDMSAMAAGVLSLFRPDPTRVMNWMMYLNTASFTAEASKAGLKAYHTWSARKKEESLLDPGMKESMKRETVQSLFELTKAAAAAVTCFTFSYSILMKNSLVSRAVQITISLVSTIFAHLAAFHNGWCRSTSLNLVPAKKSEGSPTTPPPYTPPKGEPEEQKVQETDKKQTENTI